MEQLKLTMIKIWLKKEYQIKDDKEKIYQDDKE